MPLTRIGWLMAPIGLLSSRVYARSRVSPSQPAATAQVFYFLDVAIALYASVTVTCICTCIYITNYAVGVMPEVVCTVLGSAAHLLDALGAILNAQVPHPVRPFHRPECAAVGIFRNGDL